MIHRTASSWQRNDKKDHRISLKEINTPSLTWQQHLQQAVTEPTELLSLLSIPHEHLAAAIQASQLFPLKVPKTFLDRIEKGNLNDPLLKQILPIGAESLVVDGFSKDPVEEQKDQPAGMIQKYHGRILLMVNGHCAINCRYCFRRHYPYADNRLNREQWQAAFEQIASDDSISEVIYSGGDPLASSDKQLHWITDHLAQIPHIKRLRIHTRLPVVIPHRITDETLEWMSSTRLSTVVVLHINHANELNDTFLRKQLHKMRLAGITLLNQAVLLKGVNDTIEDLTALSESLFDAGIIPYYLHTLDPVDGAAHFDVEITKAKALHQQMVARLPGYLVPKLVKEEANQPSKTSL